MTQCNEPSTNPYAQGYDPEESGFHPSVIPVMQFLSDAGSAREYEYKHSVGVYCVFVPRSSCYPNLWSRLSNVAIQNQTARLRNLRIDASYIAASDGIWVTIYPKEIHGDSDGLP